MLLQELEYEVDRRKKHSASSTTATASSHYWICFKKSCIFEGVGLLCDIEKRVWSCSKYWVAFILCRCVRLRFWWPLEKSKPNLAAILESLLPTAPLYFRRTPTHTLCPILVVYLNTQNITRLFITRHILILLPKLYDQCYLTTSGSKLVSNSCPTLPTSHLISICAG